MAVNYKNKAFTYCMFKVGDKRAAPLLRNINIISIFNEISFPIVSMQKERKIIVDTFEFGLLNMKGPPRCYP